MIRVKKLVDMVCTEAITGQGREDAFHHGGGKGRLPEPPQERGDYSLPPINYGLELIERKDGTLVWVEN